MKKTKFEIVLLASAQALASVIEKKDPYTNGKDFGETIFIAEAIASMGDNEPIKDKEERSFPTPFEYIVSLPVTHIETLYNCRRWSEEFSISMALVAMGED